MLEIFSRIFFADFLRELRQGGEKMFSIFKLRGRAQDYTGMGMEKF